ncbi:MAG: hypothetical protein KKC75_01950 [Nanoarchaeota archaeon]|nr:hypothetical protein [Nanoarchaeota archaeon]MBU1004744.1 hypothetical protein [Nanoarchaeota archaeon]MBU1945442.1 hypothetical protein [Nanoarchaeota archaeon]
MLKKAIDELYSEFPYSYSLNYSGKFKPYRGNIRLRGDRIELNLSRKWKIVSEDIQIGLVQELLLKILKKRLKPIRTKTSSMELYDIFMKKIYIAAPKTENDAVLEESFDRVNEKYFYGLLDKTNFVWGNSSFSKLGSYEYGTDTIEISRALENVDVNLLDYVMYHEMLHKKHKFVRRGSRSYHHTNEFKREEKEFEGSSRIERELRKLLIKKRLSFRNVFRGFF